MNQLPPEYAEPMKAFVEARKPWSDWPRWLSLNAHRLARLLPRDHMRRLREEPATFLPGLLAAHGVACEPPTPSGEEGRSRPDEWALAICEDVSSLRVLSRLREAMGLPLSEVAELRRRLPGVYRRGTRDELERLQARLEGHGLRASAFPAWQLDAPPGDDRPDPIADEEYEVYTAVGHTDLLRFELPDITFCDFAGDDPFCRGRVAERFRGLFRDRVLRHPELPDDYERRNAEGGRLRRRFRTRGGYQFLSERRRKNLCEDGGVVSVTRVGFGRAGTLALVGMSYYGGPLCGFGCFLLFERPGEQWQELDRYGVWVS
jgi:hypothetical protein